jgi:thymidylate synthase (FAD)
MGGTATGDSEYVITTNFRVLVENNWLDDLQYLCPPTESHEKRYTMRFTCSRAIANELVRHRTMSFLQESTRYINYSKERHGGEINYIMPSWFLRANATQQKAFMRILKDTESYYMALLGKWDDKKPDRRFKTEFKDNPLTPQQARDVLPNATKTELIMTGFASDWARLFELRLYESTGKVAPDMKVLMQKAWKEFENYGITRDLERYIKL